MPESLEEYVEGSLKGIKEDLDLRVLLGKGNGGVEPAARNRINRYLGSVPFREEDKNQKTMATALLGFIRETGDYNK